MRMPGPAETHSVSFGEVLRHYRAAASLTQEELAEGAGVSRLTISSLERGVRHVPHKDTLRRLADALQLPDRDRDRLHHAARRAVPGGRVPAGEQAIRPDHFISPPLIGRRRELDTIERHIEGEGPRMMVVAGEPGIGKTRLLHAAKAYARQYGFRVLSGDGQRRRVAEPYAPLSEALARHIHGQGPLQRGDIVRSFPWLVRLLPEFTDDLDEPLPSISPDSEPRLVFESVAAYLRAPGADGQEHALGTALILDDLQWAGPDALELLSALTRLSLEENAAPLRIVGAYRDTEVEAGDDLSRTLADLVPGRLATELPLEPLDQEAAMQMLRTILVESEQHVLDRIRHQAGGIPFFLIGLSQDARRGGYGIPRDLAQSVRSRIVTLPRESREIVELASLIGGTVPHDLLLKVSGESEETIARALDLLYRSKLLFTEGEASSRFANTVIRAVVEQDIGSASRTLTRRRIERVASELGPGPG